MVDEGYYVVVLDICGFGDSDCVFGVDYVVEILIIDVLYVVEVIGCCVVVVEVSMGGLIGILVVECVGL